MSWFIREEEFKRYVQQHDDRQNRFFEEHNGSLALIRTEIEKTNKMIEEYNRQIAVLLAEEVQKREGCAREHNRRLEKLERCVNEQGVKLRVPGWIWRAAVAAAVFTSTVLSIVVAVKVLI